MQDTTVQRLIPRQHSRLLAGGGAAGDLLRRHDWRGSLGPIESWPLSLCLAVSTVMNSPRPMWLLWGRDGILIYNDGFAASCSCLDQKIFGQPVELAWPEAAAFSRKALDVCLAGGSLSYRDEHLSLKGACEHLREIWLDIDYSPVLAENGEPGGALVVIIDTTERVRATAENRGAQKLQEEILDGIGDGFLALDHRLRFTFFNSVCERFFGVSREGIIGKHLLEAFPVGAGTAFEACYTRVLTTGEAERFEIESVAKAGRFLDMRVFPTEQGIGVCFTDVSERRRTERATRESQEQFRTLADNISQFAWMADAGGWIYWYNKRWYDYTGSSHGEMQGWGWNRVLHPEHAARVNEHLTFCFATGTPWEDTFPLRGRDGSYHWFLSRALPIFDAGGQIVRWFGTSTDISEQIAAEDALRESEARFRVTADSAPALIWASDSEGTITFVNRRHETELGLPTELVLSEGCALFLHEDDIPTYTAAFDKALHEASAFTAEVRMWNKDRQLRWFRCEATPRFNGDGEFLGFIGCNVDITEARLAADVLEAEVQLRTRERDRVWNVSQDMLLVTDQRGRWLRVNPAWTRVLGWRETDLLGKKSDWLEHPDERESTRAVVRAAAQGRSIKFQNRMRHREGDYRWFSWTGVLDDGLYYFVARDVTEEKNAAELLHRTEEALRQSQKMEAVGQLTGGIAHDFNNLLTGVMGNLDMLRTRLEAGEAEETGHFIEAAVASASSAASLTQRLLAFSRRQSLDPQAVEVNQMISSMEELLRRTLGENIGLDISVRPDLWNAECDSNQLESAILNLAINARDAMGSGGMLSIETSNATLEEGIGGGPEEAPAPGDYVSICVSDTGTGMPPEVMQRAFDPFFTTKPIGQGTGLGLSMVYGFARQSRGYVRLYSEVDVGTTIELYLPRTLEAVKPREEAAAPRDVRAGGGETVLVVEDDPAVRLLVAELLRDRGYAVIEARDARGAVPILASEQRIDLLVSDIGLPGMNGRELAEEARRHRPDLRVLFMTGYAEMAAVRSEFLDAGMGMINKPFAIRAFVAKLQDMLARA